MDRTLSKGFPPIVGSRPRVLILGSLPSTRSIAVQQYYAHPQNKFWPIMQAIVGVDQARPYAERVEALAKAGIAVWDVLKTSIRPGSLDSAIVASASVANDFKGFFSAHPEIEAVFFNGQAAARIYDRQVHSTIELGDREICYYTMPSTSPAHASMTLQEKQKHWAKLKEHL